MHVSPVTNSKGEVIFFVAIERDITPEKEIEQRETEFISTASHQLRTPMTGIRWVVERILKKETKLTARGKEYLRDIEKSTTRLSQLIDALLNVSRLDSARVSIIPEPIELVGVLKGYFDECRPLIDKKQLKFTFKSKLQKLPIESDRSALRNIIQSVVSNAIEYTPEAGKITVSLEKAANTFTVAVADTGIGIPKEAQRTIFEKFVRAANAQLVKTDGTGLGLYIAREATKFLGGKIWFESEENKGTTFFVTLPLKSKKKEGERTLS